MTSDNTTTGDAKISAGDPDERAEVVQCEVCLTEVPLSAAKSAEALDYVHYFCGLNCLQTWLGQDHAKAADNR